MSTNNTLVNTVIVREMLIKNEVGTSSPYVISHAQKGRSGYSFGQCQWDLSKNADGRKILEDILRNSDETFSDEEVRIIMDEVTKTNGDISAYKDRINQALNSEYGREAIDQGFTAEIDRKLTRLDNLISELKNANGTDDPTVQYIESNIAIQMMLIDYDNQLRISGIDTPGTINKDGALMQFLKNDEATINRIHVEVQGDFDITDYLNFLFKTKWANNLKDNGARDLLRRLSNITAIASKNGLSAEDRQLLNNLTGLRSLKISAQELLGRIRQLFTLTSTLPIFSVSPIILDLDGNGIETINVKDGAYFDHGGNGFAEQTGWASSDEGFLVMDRNEDGIINDGKEFFGSETLLSNGTKAANGFQALVELDDNQDGKIDANDAVYANLKIWKDADGDGYSSSDEFLTLSEAGVASINTSYTDSTMVDAQGNEHRQVGSFTRSDGTTGTATDVWFKIDPAYTIATEWLDVPEDIAALPDLQGYGNVYDLQQAMVRDTSGQLKGLVEQFINTTDTTTRNSLMEQILFKWTGSDGIAPGSRGGSIVDARKLVVLEKFFGQNFSGTNGPNPHGFSAPFLKQSYQGLFEMFYAQLMAQTHLKDLYGMIAYTWDEATETVKADLSAVITEIQNCLNANYEDGKKVLSEFTRTIKGFQAEDMMDFKTFRTVFASQSEELAWIIDSAGKNPISGTSGNDFLNGTDNPDAIRGRDGKDLIYGNDGNDALYGGEGDDQLYGGFGDDILDGGAGNDFLKGESGNDIYKFGIGSGQDTISVINVVDSYNRNADVVEFGEGITVAHFELFKENYNLRINIKGTTDALIIQDWFAGDNFKAGKFIFADGTTLTAADIDAMDCKLYGTAGRDSLEGTKSNNEIYGYEGNDNLLGGDGNDRLYGGSGNDAINGGNGDDMLDGGEGNDQIEGSIGNDYLDGEAGIDTILGGDGDDELFGGEGNDLLQGDAGNDYLDGEADTDTILGAAGSDTLFGGDGNDSLHGDSNDTAVAEQGDDYLDGEAGDDRLIGYGGNDQLFGGVIKRQLFEREVFVCVGN
jgi:Ca2+-binding RTX toxin-like protein